MHRPLTEDEIRIMSEAGCEADDWTNVTVADGFDPERVRRTIFSGGIRLGRFTGNVTLPGGMVRQTGIYDAVLHQVEVGDEVLISKIDQYIANYIIEDRAVIYEVNSLIVSGESSFGNGVLAAVINEGGGREVMIIDHLSSHLAYMSAAYRFRPVLIDKLMKMKEDYCTSVRSCSGVIGNSARLLGCGPMKDVRIGAYARIEGAAKLENGTVNSCREDPASVGFGVVAENFIIAEGSKVTNGVILDHCYIGQSCELSKQYSAENSVFFANCAGFHGEACSIFAGPFTVTHHKSTLLIAALVSFLNAGSGSNQSNHMYKLGPNHQGIIERGSKTASDSYMLFPMHVGAFSVVMGRHYNNSDTSELPFSYLIEHDGESLLIPGVNLRSVGTVRDSRKWPRRDKRTCPSIDDKIIYHLLTPYTVQHIMRGQQKLKEIRDQAGHSSVKYFYNGVQITKSALEKGLVFYGLAVSRYLGNIVVNRLRECPMESPQQVLNSLRPVGTEGRGSWIDVSGLLVPQEVFERLLVDIEEGAVSSISQIDERIDQMYRSFPEYELSWVMARICEEQGKLLSELCIEDLILLIERWIGAVTELDLLRKADAQKEFAQSAKVGYAINGDIADRNEEYEILHGTSEDNDFIKDLQARLEAKQNTAGLLIRELRRISEG